MRAIFLACAHYGAPMPRNTDPSQLLLPLDIEAEEASLVVGTAPPKTPATRKGRAQTLPPLVVNVGPIFVDNTKKLELNFKPALIGFSLVSVSLLIQLSNCSVQAPLAGEVCEREQALNAWVVTRCQTRQSPLPH